MSLVIPISVYFIAMAINGIIILYLFIIERRKINLKLVIFFLLITLCLTFIFLLQEASEIKRLVVSIVTLCILPIVFHINSILMNQKYRAKLTNSLFWIAIFAGIFGLIQYYFKFPFIPVPEGSMSVNAIHFRSISFFSSIQQYACFMLLVSTLLLIEIKSLRRAIVVWCLGLTSGSQLLFVGFFLVCFLYLFFRKQYKILLFISTLLLISIITLNLLGSSSNKIAQTRVLQPFIISSDTNFNRHTANNDRVDVWRGVLEHVDNPLTGKVLGDANPYYHSNYFNAESYFLALYNDGGLLLIIVMFSYLLYRYILLRGNRKIYILLYFFIGIAVHVLFAISILWFFFYWHKTYERELT